MPLEKDKSGGFTTRLDEEVNTGLWPDVFAHRIPLWEYGENIQFTEFGLEKIKGAQTVTDTTLGDPIRGLLQTKRQETNTLHVHMGDLTQLYDYEIDANTLTVRGTGYNLVENSGSAIWDAGASTWDNNTSLWDNGITKAAHWSMLAYGDFVLATNGIDFPQIYKPAIGPNFGDLVGTDLGVSGTIEIFIARGPHILGFNTNISDKEFIWCDADNPDDWVAADNNLAGQLEIRELKTDIRAAVSLGGRIAVYGEDQMFVVNYLGNDLVFGYQPAINGIGAVSKHAVVPVGRNNYGLSTQGFFVTDGSSYEYIDDPAMRHWFQLNISRGQIEKVIGYHDEENNQIRWYFPTGSVVNNYCVSYNYKRSTWSFITGDRSAGDERRIAGAPITGTETGLLKIEGIGYNEDSLPITAFARSKPVDLGAANLVKEVDSLRIGLRGRGLQYRIGWSELESGPINWLPYRPSPEGFNFDNLRTSGRWLYLELYSDTLNADWEVMSLEIMGRLEGTR